MLFVYKNSDDNADNYHGNEQSNKETHFRAPDGESVRLPIGILRNWRTML